MAIAESLPDRESAVRRCGELMAGTGRVDAAYTDEMLAVLAEYGPYIVIAPGWHWRTRGRARRHEVAFSILTLDPPIPFGHLENDPVRLVVGMAAPDADVHVEALRQLAELLGDDGTREGLMTASSPETVMGLIAAPASRAADERER